MLSSVVPGEGEGDDHRQHDDDAADPDELPLGRLAVDVLLVDVEREDRRDAVGLAGERGDDRRGERRHRQAAQAAGQEARGWRSRPCRRHLPSLSIPAASSCRSCGAR